MRSIATIRVDVRQDGGASQRRRAKQETTASSLLPDAHVSRAALRCSMLRAAFPFSHDRLLHDVNGWSPPRRAGFSTGLRRLHGKEMSNDGKSQAAALFLSIPDESGEASLFAARKFRPWNPKSGALRHGVLEGAPRFLPGFSARPPNDACATDAGKKRFSRATLVHRTRVQKQCTRTDGQRCLAVRVTRADSDIRRDGSVGRSSARSATPVPRDSRAEAWFGCCGSSRRRVGRCQELRPVAGARHNPCPPDCCLSHDHARLTPPDAAEHLEIGLRKIEN